MSTKTATKKTAQTVVELPADNVRNRILATARDLIYREGARAVGVDRIVAESGVAKTSLYRWFKSKDDLIAAVLESEQENVLAHWDRNVASHNSPLDQLRAQFKSVEEYIVSPEFRGCCFLNAATAFADDAHPARIQACAFKEEITRRIFVLCKAFGARQPKLLADQLSLLIDGAYISAQTVGLRGPCVQLQETAETLIQAQLPANNPSVRAVGRKS